MDLNRLKTNEAETQVESAVFSKEQAVVRAKLALTTLSLPVPQNFEELIENTSNPIFIDDSNLEIRNVNEQYWYPFVYDEKSQEYYYVGTDGALIPLMYESTDPPKIPTGWRKDILWRRENLIGNNPENREQAVVLATEGLKKALPYLKLIEHSSDISLELLQNTLQAMSLEEYVDVMKKLSGYFATHVTRVGVREITSGFHYAGEGNYFNSAFEVFESNSLASEYNIKKSYAQENPDNLPISRSVHVAPELVDINYGAEEDNIPLFFFPAEVLMYNYGFSTNNNPKPDETGGNANWEISGLSRDSTDPSNNVDINLGICFLPKSTLVDPETGSKYQVESGKAVPFEERINALKLLLSSDVEDLDEKFNTLKEEYWNSFDHIDFGWEAKKELDKKYAAKAYKLLKPYGFDKEMNFMQASNILGGVKEWKGLFDTVNEGDYPWSMKQLREEILDKTLEEKERIFLVERLTKARAVNRPAKNAITAQEFWENWFNQHNNRPPRIVFYDGDPNEAVIMFLLNSGIITESDVKKDWHEKGIKLRQRNKKFVLPSDCTVDLGLVKLHETGNFMLRVGKYK